LLARLFAKGIVQHQGVIRHGDERFTWIRLVVEQSDPNVPPQEKPKKDAIAHGAEALVKAAVMDYSLALQQPSLIGCLSIGMKELVLPRLTVNK
jgi:hypothetical protein